MSDISLMPQRGLLLQVQVGERQGGREAGSARDDEHEAWQAYDVVHELCMQ